MLSIGEKKTDVIICTNIKKKYFVGEKIYTMSELQTPSSMLIYALLCDRVVKIGNKMRRQVAKYAKRI